MSFLQCEHDKINAMIREIPLDREGSEVLAALHLAQQALAWALDPNHFASPSATIQRWYVIGADGTQGTGIGQVQPLPEHTAPQ